MISNTLYRIKDDKLFKKTQCGENEKNMSWVDQCGPNAITQNTTLKVIKIWNCVNKKQESTFSFNQKRKMKNILWLFVYTTSSHHKYWNFINKMSFFFYSKDNKFWEHFMLVDLTTRNNAHTIKWSKENH